MVVTIHDLICAINPNKYYDGGSNKGEAKKKLNKFKDLIKQKGISSAAKKAKSEPLAEYKIVYDSPTEQLEPVYFFVLDLMNDFGLDAEKLVDNFSSSPGSGHFGELGQRATVMQQQGGKILGDINTVLRSVLNIIYDLKEFKIRLQTYDDYDSDDKAKREAALLSLKQIWLDKVDIARGQGSIHAMTSGQLGFQTLRDAFLAVKDAKLKGYDGKEIDLNDRVKRILKPRILEFNTWLKHSEEELRKRYNLERTYLKSQVNSLKLYSRWARPYLLAAQKLEMKESNREAALVSTFDTLLLELTLFGKNKIKIKDEAIAGNLPTDFAKLKNKRNYYSCIVVDFKFRSIPQRVAQQSHYAFGGRAEITFSCYALNSQELDKLDEELDKSDVGNTLDLIEGATNESLEQLQKEIDYFLKEDEEEKKSKRSNDKSNPFLALIGHYDKNEPKEKKDDSKKEVKISSETWIEKTHIRPFAEDKAEDTAFKLFDIYKKAHGMASYT